jgi:CDP-diacylglycerol--serine O-phosphatidyltransferase
MNNRRKENTHIDKSDVKNIGTTWMLPNLLTISALLCGMSAVRFAFQDRWEAAVLMVAVAGAFDMLDGRMARILKVSSDFGAHLDTLSDMVVFGVVPSMILYLWVLDDGGRLAWTACMFYTVCNSLRLARFNSELHETPSWAANYFVGIPSPAAAFLALVPLVASFRLDWPMLQYWPVVASWLAFVGIGAISSVPTFAGKKTNLRRASVLPLMGFFAFVVAVFVSRPWETWVILAFAYLAIIPFSMFRFRNISRREES